MDSALARRVLTTTFPERRVSDPSALRAGNVKRTFTATVDGDAVVVQLHSDPARLHVEATLTRAVGDRTSLRVPTVRATGTLDGHGYLLTDRAPGEDLHERFTALDRSERRSVVATFGRALGELHEVFRFDGHGPVGVDGDDLVVETSRSWAAWFDHLTATGLDAFPEALADLRPRIERALADRPAADHRSTLFPWDLRPGNARYDGSVTFLDWGGPMTATAECSLAKTEYVVVDWYTPSPALREAFHDGYRRSTTLAADYWGERRPYYRLAAVVRTAVDSRGVVTRPGYPERDGDAAVRFHRDHLEATLAAVESRTE
ncbi:phosphotransferase family protein [Halomarina oriensis]|uniref:Phosphotransferase n=1 Tax=Halomarina oriensis TaxID=671145 RepID=A0A6B0GND3_9EURY|nr:phosphotransferase [Halomarina oriensis]